MIRDSIKNICFNALDFDIFRMEDFVIYEETEENSYIINITYDKYYCRIDFPFDEHVLCEIKCTPGTIFVEGADAKSINYLGKIVETVHNWLNRLKEEVMKPLERRYIDGELQHFQEQLNNKLDEMDDSYFTRAEAKELKERLKILEEMIQNNSNESNAEIEKIGKEIEFLKTTIDSSTKKKWIKNALTKIWTWGQNPENQKLIENSISVVKAISQIDIPDIKG